MKPYLSFLAGTYYPVCHYVLGVTGALRATRLSFAPFKPHHPAAARRRDPLEIATGRTAEWPLLPIKATHKIYGTSSPQEEEMVDGRGRKVLSLVEQSSSDNRLQQKFGQPLSFKMQFTGYVFE